MLGIRLAAESCAAESCVLCCVLWCCSRKPSSPDSTSGRRILEVKEGGVGRIKSMEKAKGSQKATVWDCGSSLYDSFELKSFQRQLDSAISSARSLSMPHLTDTRRFPPPPHHHQAPPQILSKKSSKITRSFNKLMRTLFRTKQSPSTLFRVQSQRAHDRVYDRYGALTTIPEVSENANAGDYEAGFSPEMTSATSSLVERSASQRFAPTSVGISHVHDSYIIL